MHETHNVIICKKKIQLAFVYCRNVSLATPFISNSEPVKSNPAEMVISQNQSYSKGASCSHFYHYPLELERTLKTSVSSTYEIPIKYSSPINRTDWFSVVVSSTPMCDCHSKHNGYAQHYKSNEVAHLVMLSKHNHKMRFHTRHANYNQIN